MITLKVYDLTRKRALITRASAAKLGDALVKSWDGGQLTVDFAGIDAITPSFVDEILAVVENMLRGEGRIESAVVFLHPPTRLSKKFAAVGRAHRLNVTESEDGAWIVATSGVVADDRPSA